MTDSGVTSHGALRAEIHPTTEELGRSAAQLVAKTINAAVAEHGAARVIFATGNSQYPLMAALADVDVPWDKVTGFHMDEYVGIDANHPASFRRWIRERIEERFHPAAIHYIDGEADPAEECARYTALLSEDRIDLVCMGIGENGHLAFNEPGDADFDTDALIAEITLQRESRQQQVNEGHFPTVADVPATALSLTIPALLSSPVQVVCVPELRKAAAVAKALTGPVTTACPASILQERGHAVVYLDAESSSAL